MKSLALVLASLTAVSAPAMAGVYVTGSAEFTGSDGEYKNRELLGRVGFDTEVGSLTPYGELGGGLSTDDGADGEKLLIAEVGTGIDITEKLSANAFYEHKKYADADDPEWKIGVGTKYRF